MPKYKVPEGYYTVTQAARIVGADEQDRPLPHQRREPGSHRLQRRDAQLLPADQPGGPGRLPAEAGAEAGGGSSVRDHLHLLRQDGRALLHPQLTGAQQQIRPHGGERPQAGAGPPGRGAPADLRIGQTRIQLSPAGEERNQIWQRHGTKSRKR